MKIIHQSPVRQSKLSVTTDDQHNFIIRRAVRESGVVKTSTIKLAPQEQRALISELKYLLTQ